MGSTVLLTILQIAAGGSFAQIVVRFGAFIYKRFSNPEQRKATVSADATSVQTADAVLGMVRSELKEVRAQQTLERAEWDAERLRTTAALDNAAREVARAQSELARVKSDLVVAQAQIGQMGERMPGRHSNPGTYDDWRRGP